MKKIITKIYLPLLFIIFTSTLNAQQQSKGSSEELQKMFIELLVKNAEKALEMSDSKLDKFNPIYKEYLKAVNPIARKKHMGISFSSQKGMSNEDIDKAIISDLEESVNIANTRLKYYHKFREFLSAKEVKKIFRSEMLTVSQLKELTRGRMKKNEQAKRNQKRGH